MTKRHITSDFSEPVELVRRICVLKSRKPSFPLTNFGSQRLSPNMILSNLLPVNQRKGCCDITLLL